jgi:hypothetical protein
VAAEPLVSCRKARARRADDATGNPNWGEACLANESKLKLGILVSPLLIER